MININSQMVFKKLIIFDVEAKESKTLSFENGVNIITSSDNQVGKSTIMKSLYYCLGGDVFFSDRLNLKSKMHFLELEIKKKNLKFIRHGKVIVVVSESRTYKFNSATSLSAFLSEHFEYKIYLESKENTYIIAPPVFYFLPYYIDQDYGWTPELKSFNKLNQFDKSKRKFYNYYHLNLLNEEFGKIQIQKKELEVDIKKLNSDLQNIIGLLEYIKNDISSYNVELDFNILKLEYENTLSKYKKYSYDLNNIRRKLLHYDEDLYKTDIVINNLNSSLREHTKVKNNIKKHFEVECPDCNAIFEVQAKDILRMNYNISDLNSSKLELIDLKEKILENKRKVQKDYEKLNALIKEIEESKVESEITFDKVLKFKGLQETNQKLSSEYTIKNAELEVFNEKLKDVKSKLNLWNEQINKANRDYREKLDLNLLLFNSTEYELPEKIEIDHTITASGSGQVRVNLARVYSFLQLKEIVSPQHIRLPLVIDSPKGGEQSVSNSELILSLLTEKMELPNQVIVATIDFDSFYKGDSSKFNVITLKNSKYSLLSNEDYIDNEEVILSYFDLYYKACK